MTHEHKGPRGGEDADAARDRLRPQPSMSRRPSQAPARQAAESERATRRDSREWLAAKAAGDRAQELVGSWFQRKGFEVLQTLGKADVDLVVQFRIEVKGDMQAHKTGNVAIETEYNGQPSGIRTSTANYWAIVVGDEAYIAETPKLRKSVLSGGFPEVSAGNRHAARVQLVPLDKLRAMPSVKVVSLGDAQA